MYHIKHLLRRRVTNCVRNIDRSRSSIDHRFDDSAKSWVNATVALTSDKQGMVLSASPPSGAKNAVATSYGWGSIPIMTVYRADMDGEDGQLPVLTWNRTI